MCEYIGIYLLRMHGWSHTYALGVLQNCAVILEGRWTAPALNTALSDMLSQLNSAGIPAGAYKGLQGLLLQKPHRRTALWLARNEGMDPYSNPCIAHYNSCHFLFPFLHSRLTKGKRNALPWKVCRTLLRQPASYKGVSEHREETPLGGSGGLTTRG